MKLLLDENLSRRIIPVILDAYPESSQIALLNMDSANDKCGRMHLTYRVWKYTLNHYSFNLYRLKPNRCQRFSRVV